jgi:hypothetical protein
VLVVAFGSACDAILALMACLFVLELRHRLVLMRWLVCACSYPPRSTVIDLNGCGDWSGPNFTQGSSGLDPACPLAVVLRGACWPCVVLCVGMLLVAPLMVDQ